MMMMTFAKLKLNLNNIALPGKSSQSYEASLAIWDHLPPVTSELNPPNASQLDLPTPEGWKAELT